MRKRWWALGAAVAASSLLGAGATGAQTGTRVVVTFATPGVTTFTVPAGICQVTVDARGAQGGSAALSIGAAAALQGHVNAAHSTSGPPPSLPPGVSRKGVRGSQAGSAGGLGGETIASLPVTPGESLVVSVGGQGTDLGAAAQPTGGAPDGGNGGNGSAGDGAGGGGSSDVRQGGSDLAHRVVIAGGGGGASAGFFLGLFFEDGGTGGGTAGGNGDPASPTNTGAGRGATQAAGGAGGTDAPFGPPGGDGSLGRGGVGADSIFGDPPGGGGGGGLYGGGGGSTFDLADVFGGGDAGGGGSGFGPPGATLTAGVNRGNGSVTISYDPASSGCVAAAAIIAPPRFTG